MRRATVFCVLALIVILVGASARAQEVLTNDGVLKLHGAGLPAAVILAKIRASQTSFDTSVEALVALSEAGVPQEVIAEMAGASSAPAAADQSIVVRQGASAAPNVAAQFGGTPCQTPGIFVDESGQLREIEPTTYTMGKSGGFFLSQITYGIKSMKSKAIIQGTTSNTRVDGGTPTFFFCFEETETGLSYETKGATNPSEFLLVEFEVKHDKGYRAFVAGKLNLWAGATSGAPPKVLRETGYEKQAPGVYKVTPRVVLSPGEYGFYYAGSAPLATYGFAPATASGGNKIFTFRVN